MIAIWQRLPITASKYLLTTLSRLRIWWTCNMYIYIYIYIYTYVIGIIEIGNVIGITESCLEQNTQPPGKY